MQAWHLFRRTSVSDCFCTALPPLANRFYFIFSTYRSSHRRCSVKKGVLWNFKRPATFLKKRLWHRCFPVNSAKLLRTCFPQNNLQNTSRWLLLHLLPQYHCYYCWYLWCLCFILKFKRLQRIWMWYVIFTESLPSLFFFFHDFLSFSVLLCFFLPLLIKRILLKWELIKMLKGCINNNIKMPLLTSLKYVHVSK